METYRTNSIAPLAATMVSTTHHSANRILKSILADTTGLDMSKYRQWLSNKGSVEAEYERVGTYISEGDYATARAVRDSMPDKFGMDGNAYDEYQYYKDYTEIILTALEDTIRLSNLDSITVLAVQDIADNSTGLAGTLAQGLLNEYYGYGYEIVPKEPGGQQGLMAPPHNNTISHQRYLPNFLAEPNPARDLVTFRFEVAKEGQASLVVFDINGHKVHAFQIDGQLGQLDWNTASLPEGVYYCQLRQKDKAPTTLKLILIK